MVINSYYVFEDFTTSSRPEPSPGAWSGGVKQSSLQELQATSFVVCFSILFCIFFSSQNLRMAGSSQSNKSVSLSPLFFLEILPTVPGVCCFGQSPRAAGMVLWDKITSIPGIYPEKNPKTWRCPFKHHSHLYWVVVPTRWYVVCFRSGLEDTNSFLRLRVPLISA